MPLKFIPLNTALDRARVKGWVDRAPPGTKIAFKKGGCRSLDQNALMWARLGQISREVEWYGRKLSPEDWKDMLTAALRQCEAVPGINGGFVVLGLRTSNMTKAEMANLLTLMEAFAAERGVVFTESEAA